jgi:hypothetical protein
MNLGIQKGTIKDPRKPTKDEKKRGRKLKHQLIQDVGNFLVNSGQIQMISDNFPFSNPHHPHEDAIMEYKGHECQKQTSYAPGENQEILVRYSHIVGNKMHGKGGLFYASKMMEVTPSCGNRCQGHCGWCSDTLESIHSFARWILHLQMDHHCIFSPHWLEQTWLHYKYIQPH